MSRPPEALALGIDIGGTKVAAGLIDGGGRLLRHLQVPTPAQDGPEAILAAVLVAASVAGRKSSSGGVRVWRG